MKKKMINKNLKFKNKKFILTNKNQNTLLID